MGKTELPEQLRVLSKNILINHGDDIDSFHSQYEVKEELGRGLTSVVYKCIDRFTGESYAVKILDLNQTNDLDIMDSIVNEVKILSRLEHHPNIISAVKVYSQDSNVYIVLELAPYGELFDYVNKFGILSEKVAAHLFRQLVMGVEQLHSLNIVHRDVKMENVLMSRTLGCKLTDFGFAKELPEGEQLHDLCGTLCYIAPEMIRAEYGFSSEGYGKTVDMWACGVLLYSLLVGNPPFYHANRLISQLQLTRRIQECRYDRSSKTWTALSDSVRSLIESLLQLDTTKRLTAEQTLSHPWVQRAEFTVEKKTLTFRHAAYLVLFVTTMQLRAVKTQNSRDDAGLDLIREKKILPYQMRSVRKAMDDVAFTIYGHWVQREDPMSRGTMFKQTKNGAAYL